MHQNVKQRLVDWIDEHPRLGWYVALISTLNVMLEVANLFK